jgi:hypothetical protein
MNNGKKRTEVSAVELATDDVAALEVAAAWDVLASLLALTAAELEDAPAADDVREAAALPVELSTSGSGI